MHLFSDRNDAIEDLRELSHILIDANAFPSRSQVKKMDTIDYSAIGRRLVDNDTDTMPTSVSKEAMAEVEKNWFLMVPPLQKGVIRLNVGRYEVYEVRSVDVENQTVEIDFTDLVAEGSLWMYNLSANCIYGVDPESGITMRHKGACMGEVIGQLINESSETFSPRLIKGLRENVLPLCRMGDEAQSDEMAICKACMTVIIEANLALMKEKPKRRAEKNKESAQPTRKVAEVREDQKNADAKDMNKPRIIRVFTNGMEIRSRETPKPSNTKTIRRYSVASWNTRGHTRTYKSGKTIYIRPSVHHRKCLNGGEAGVRQTIIKVDKHNNVLSI